MSRKTWLVWALVLLLLGAVGLSTYCAQKKTWQERIAQAAKADSQDPAGPEYLKIYEEWSNLPAEEKADNPWGYNLYGGAEIRNRLVEGQANRLLRDLPKLAKGLTDYPDELIENLYGSNWQEEVEKYRAALNHGEILLAASTFLLACGGLILGGAAAKTLFAAVIGKSKKKKEDAYPPISAPEVQSAGAKDNIENAASNKENKAAAVEDPQPDCRKTEALESCSDASPETSGRQNTKAGSEEGYFQAFRKSSKKVSADSGTKETALPLTAFSQKALLDKPAKDSYFGWAVEMETSSPLESLMTTEPLTRELTELTEEVSAIRQFAAQQQDQMRKLQDGYDWVIIRRFCLRIIRSIDNIEDRIAALDSSQTDTAACLQDIRDELVFALESSGIEQFEPDLNIPYKGLEKYAEAVRQRIPTDNPELVGCIARVVRPGYQYLINDDNVKIVRCAQVNLYEAKQSLQE
ncbi:MAG TPA: hypothetical protein PK052_12945 [Anaerohalosphaeraceae bacterium]|nr:hypothetical protein [Anaerohalosphaeraceae bacterium]HOM77493.1 hypothetical protein [Anaerohalosphaeraceae bacterium]HPO70977.1 hypothetical protein [Anaerohalosphaeraceae bacterium]